jgi:hypothetical protein
MLNTSEGTGVLDGPVFFFLLGGGTDVDFCDTLPLLGGCCLLPSDSLKVFFASSNIEGLG